MASLHFSMQAISIHVIGKVQGVFFRQSAKELALNLKIFGFIRNENDGSVYIEVEGSEKNLKKFIEWCSKGPEKASVSKIEVKSIPEKKFSAFEIC